MNIEINTINTLIEKVWEKRAIQTLRLVNSMWFYNEVDFNILWLKEDWLKKLRACLSKEWIVAKWKIWENSWYKWYINPYYFNRWKVREELYNLFERYNKTLY